MEFTEILEAILKARYGKDVRQSIHDGIKACKDTVDAGMGEYDKKLSDAEKEHTATLNNGLKECNRKLNDALTEYDKRLSIGVQTQQSVDFNVEQGSYWNINHDRTITKYGPSSQYLSYASTVIPVTEGEVYEVHCAKKVVDSYYVPGPIIAVRNATNSAADGVIDIYETPIDGNNQYVITVPAGAKFLLINHVVKDYSGIDLEIYKRNSLEDVVEEIVHVDCAKMYAQSFVFEESTKIEIELNNLRHALVFIRLDPGTTVSNYGLTSFYDESGNSKGTLAELGSIANKTTTYQTSMIQFDSGSPVQFARWGEQGGASQMVVRNGAIGNYAVGISKMESFRLSKIVLPPITGTVNVSVWGY